MPSVLVMGQTMGQGILALVSVDDSLRRIVRLLYLSPPQSTINRMIGLDAAVQASQNKIRNLTQAATDSTIKHKSATTLQRTEQTTIDHLTHYNQLLKEQILSRRQILDRLESTELQHERVDSDTNNERVKHDRRQKDMEHRRIIWRAKREQQELKQHTLESHLNRQQKFETKRNAKRMDTEMRTEVKEAMTARELRETLEQERRQRQNHRRSPPSPNAITEKETFRRHDPSVNTAHDENFSRLYQEVHERDLKPKNDPSHRQTSAPAVVIENDDSLYAVSELSIKISKPAAAAAAAAAAAPSEQNTKATAYRIEIPFLHRLNNDDDNDSNNNKQTPSPFIEEQTIRPCQPSADALASVIHGLEGELAISKQKLSELVKLYNDHNAALEKRVRKSLAIRIKNLLAETERKSDYLYSLHDVVVVSVVYGK